MLVTEYVAAPTKGSKGDYGAQFLVKCRRSLPDAPKIYTRLMVFKGKKVFEFVVPI
jgi:hypothetical protein